MDIERRSFFEEEEYNFHVKVLQICNENDLTVFDYIQHELQQGKIKFHLAARLLQNKF